VVLDASKGSLCEVVISACVNNIIVKGNKDSFVSVVFQPTFSRSGTNLQVLGDLSGSCEVSGNFQNSLVINDYEIGNIRIGNIHTFSILGIQRGVTFGTVVNKAKYFTINQTKDILSYGLTQGGIAHASLNRKQLQLLTSDTFIVSSFINYGHFLVKTTNLGSVSYKADDCSKPKKKSNGNCLDAFGDAHCDPSLEDNRTFWLVNILVKCKLTSTGRNKNFRVPLGIFYLWAGAEVRLCNVSCEYIRGPEPCKCFDAVCYDPDATKAPLVNCIAVVCGISEILPDKLPCSPNVSNKQSVIWNNCSGEEKLCDIGEYSGSSDVGEYSGSDDNSSHHLICSPKPNVIFGKNFEALSVNPCFIKKANLVIKNSDLVICELVKRVWTSPLGYQVIDNASCDPHHPKPFISNSFDKTYVKTVTPSVCGKNNVVNSSFIYSYLVNFEVNTPALYFGKNMDHNTEWNMANIRVDRFVHNLGSSAKDNGWPHQGSNNNNNYGYSLMLSKCKDDPVIDPKTTLPRRCCDLTSEYSIPDRVRPYCHSSFAPTQLSPACRPIISNNDVLNTVCHPVCAEYGDVLPSVPANGNSANTNIILNKACCKVQVPNKKVCVVKPTKSHYENIKHKLCDDWDECSIDSSNKPGEAYNEEWENASNSSSH
jgi:hypothetical protein